MKNALFWSLAVAAGGSLAAAGYTALRPPAAVSGLASTPDDPPLVVTTDRDLGSVPLGRTPVTFAITNPAGRPRRVLGADGGCKVNCMQPAADEQFLIPAGSTVEFPCVVTARRPGPFQLTLSVVLEDAGGVREVVLTARGECVPKEQSR